MPRKEKPAESVTAADLEPKTPPKTFGQKALGIFVGLISAIVAPTPKVDICELLERHVVVPLIVGSPFPGPLDIGRMPQWRGLLRRLADRRCRFFTLCKSARVGGSLFFGIALILWKIMTKPGPILWVDPTRKTAGRFSRQELQPFLRECPPVAKQIVEDKKSWTTFEMILRVCTLGLVGAGSVADLGGRQAEMVIVNEEDKRAFAPPRFYSVEGLILCVSGGCDAGSLIHDRAARPPITPDNRAKFARCTALVPSLGPHVLLC